MTEPDLADLDAFAAVARYRSFRGAATVRGVSASTLSEAVRRLETRLRVRLCGGRAISQLSWRRDRARRLGLDSERGRAPVGDAAARAPPQPYDTQRDADRSGRPAAGTPRPGVERGYGGGRRGERFPRQPHRHAQ